MPATLAQRFQAEIRRSPKKAALLALLACVALWYWAPLLTRFGSGKAGNAKQSLGSELTATVAPPVMQPLNAASPKQQAAPAGPAWDAVLAQIKSDARMRSAAALAVSRDPFRPKAADPKPTAEQLAGQESQPIEQQEPEEQAAPVLEEEPVELPLTAIIFGRARRSALIGGRTYQQGEVCPAHGMEFRIVAIGRGHITVERLADGYRFDQPLPRHQHTPHLEIRRGP